ncbi:hypothetical protein ACGYLI_16705 [Sulfitobacter sp. 1A13421]|uniref:hypothetical protein n=1 Tax=Sulfitobacter sp. 1A13421 TaxID=3368595 RepID=UPI003746FA96
MMVIPSIIKAEVIQDGTQIAKTNRGSQAVGVAVGAIALGGVGALIGGLSGSSTTRSGIKKLSLRFTVDSTDEPSHEFTFYESPKSGGTQSGDSLLKDQSKLLAKFAGYLETAIRRAEEGRAPAPVVPLPLQDKSVGDQIADLWKLKELGALTQSEFDSQKAKLIDS